MPSLKLPGWSAPLAPAPWHQVSGLPNLDQRGREGVKGRNQSVGVLLPNGAGREPRASSPLHPLPYPNTHPSMDLTQEEQQRTQITQQVKIRS